MRLVVLSPLILRPVYQVPQWIAVELCQIAAALSLCCLGTSNYWAPEVRSEVTSGTSMTPHLLLCVDNRNVTVYCSIYFLAASISV